MMYVGELAKRAGVTPKAVRYYERLGLLRARRTPSGYRAFDERSVEIMRSIRRAQLLGLPLEEIRGIVELLHQGQAPCAHVRAMLAEKRADVAQRIRELRAFDRFLAELESTAQSESAASREDAGCPILARVNAGARDVARVTR